MSDLPTKRCPKCGKAKPLDEFHPRRINGREKRQSYCKQCCTGAWGRWRDQQGGDYQRKYNLARYGISEDEYAAMLAAQGGVCAICKRPQTAKGPRGTPRRLDVDHCHDSGRVRGLLCLDCNRGLGAFKDNISVLYAAAMYVGKHAVTTAS